MAYRWDLPDGVWLEDEHGRFAPAADADLGRLDPAQLRTRAADVAALLGAARPLGCAHAPLYPPGFAYCPQCGQPLARAQGDGYRDWFGPASDPFLPRHVPHGLPVTALALGAALEGRARGLPPRPDCTMPAPPNAVCAFAAGHYGFPVQRLLALAPARGVLQYWDPARALWQVLLAEPGAPELVFDRADHAWLPAWQGRRGEVAIVPSNDALLRLWINPVNETWHAQVLVASRLASAPGLLHRHLACIVDGGRALWTSDVEFSGEERFPLDVPAGGWSRPFSYDARLVWLHADGQLAWRPGAAPVFTPWPEGWNLRREFGAPTQSRDGRIWHVGHDGGGYSFVELLAAAPEQRRIDGARLGFANFLFRRGHEVKGDPWDEEHVEEQQADDALVLPLLRAFNNNRALPSGLVVRVPHYTGRAEDALGGRALPRATLEWIGNTNVVLDEVARLAHPQACTPVLYDGVLWVHHPDWPAMRGWRLEGTP